MNNSVVPVASRDLNDQILYNFANKLHAYDSDFFAIFSGGLPERRKSNLLNVTKKQRVTLTSKVCGQNEGTQNTKLLSKAKKLYCSLGVNLKVFGV